MVPAAVSLAAATVVAVAIAAAAGAPAPAAPAPAGRAPNTAAPAASGRTAQVAVIPQWRSGDGRVRFALQESASNSASAAHGTFEDKLLLDGWGVLNVATNAAFSDLDQAFAAGMAEGFLTARHIFDAQRNLYPRIFGDGIRGFDKVPHEVVQFMDRQEAWTRVMVDEHSGTDPFWAHVGYLMAQFDGLVVGYAAAAQEGSVPPLERFSFQMLNGVGDLLDVIPAAMETHRIDWLSLSREDAELRHTKAGHCSGIIKLPGDFSDLFMSHSSWYSYGNTDRIFKHYLLNYTDPSTAAKRISFSSYPGFLESLDDFYLLDSGLGWIQTTNTVVDHSVYDEVKPQSLLAWQRVRVASAMAHSGQEWYGFLKRHFSGTYANQYMIVDFKLFEPKRPIKPNTLWVIEEMPGLVIGGDRSETLARGYWPSYNMPYFEEVYKKSGYPAMAAKHGTYFTYELSPRAQIFRRDQASVTDLDSLKALMRSNNYLLDPYSRDSQGRPDPNHAICARGDLSRRNRSTDGCYDTKVTSYNFGALQLRAQAVNGPPHDGDLLRAFSWEEPLFAAELHVGLPETYRFDFVDVKPGPASRFSAAPADDDADRYAIVYV